VFLKQVAQRGITRGARLVQGLDRDRVLEDPRSGERLARAHRDHRRILGVDLHPAGSDHADHPHELRAAFEQLANLRLELLLVLSCGGVLHREGGHALDPSEGVWDVADRDVGRAQVHLVGGVASVEARGLDQRVGAEDLGAQDAGAGMGSAGRGAVYGVAIDELVAISLSHMVGAEGTGADHGLVGGHDGSVPAVEGVGQAQV